MALTAFREGAQATTTKAFGCFLATRSCLFPMKNFLGLKKQLLNKSLALNGQHQIIFIGL